MFRRLCRAVRKFLRTTTLHGFKYLDTPQYLDRVGWLVCCCAGVSGAVMMCIVLLMQFHHAPLLLSQVPISNPSEMKALEHSAPLVAICPPPVRAAQLLAENVSKDLKDMEWLPKLLSKILRGKSAPDADLARLDRVLNNHNLTLYQALVDFNSPCEELLRKCLWQSTAVLPCTDLFGNELTRWGVCCVMRPKRILELDSFADRMKMTTERIDLKMDCYVMRNDSYCCEVYIRYPDEGWLGPWALMSGRSYTAHITFTSIQDSVKSKLVNGPCVSTPLYSQSRCMTACKEIECGCSHPLRIIETFETNLPPPCSVMQMACLENDTKTNNPCNCLPACQRIAARMSLEANNINETFYCYNPVYENVNSISSLVLRLRIRIWDSKSYDLLPTESWLTLLSALGGVFNMFLGVSLFSLLECLNLLLKIIF